MHPCTTWLRCTVANSFSKCRILAVMFLFALRQELKKLGLGSEVDLHVSEVPVEYQTVQSLVPSLWKQYRPLVRGKNGVLLFLSLFS